MEINKIRRKERPKKIMISLLITPEVSEWMKAENISPTAAFNEAIKELMEKTENGKQGKNSK